jgi:polyhydroxyalkanoate synthesis regulator protein
MPIHGVHYNMRATISKNTRCPLKIIKKMNQRRFYLGGTSKYFFKNAIAHLKIISFDTTHPSK